jgi:hypothetical protein
MASLLEAIRELVAEVRLAAPKVVRPSGLPPAPPGSDHDHDLACGVHHPPRMRGAVELRAATRTAILRHCGEPDLG